MKQDENIIYDRIIDHLSNNLPHDQKLIFEKLLESSPEYQKKYNEVKAIWEGTVENKYTGNQSKAFEQLNKNLSERESGFIKRHIFTISVAASLIILIASGWFLNHSTVEMVSYTTNEDTFIKDTLKDGSIVYLYPSSKLEMKDEKNTSYNKEMKLEGEAFFVVPSSENKEIIITVGDAAIKVNSTSFRINAEKNGEISVMVESGTVELSSEKINKKKLLVKAGEQGYYSKTNNQIWKQEKRDNIYLIYQPTSVN